MPSGTIKEDEMKNWKWKVAWIERAERGDRLKNRSIFLCFPIMFWANGSLSRLGPGPGPGPGPGLGQGKHRDLTLPVLSRLTTFGYTTLFRSPNPSHFGK